MTRRQISSFAGCIPPGRQPAMSATSPPALPPRRSSQRQTLTKSLLSGQRSEPAQGSGSRSASMSRHSGMVSVCLSSVISSCTERWPWYSFICG